MPFGASSFWAIAVRARAAVCGARLARDAGTADAAAASERAQKGTPKRRRSRVVVLSSLLHLNMSY
jgi:hypothetical protein